MLRQFFHCHSGTCSLEQGFKVMLWTEAKNLLGSLFLYSTQNNEWRWFKIVKQIYTAYKLRRICCAPRTFQMWGPMRPLTVQKRNSCKQYILQSVVSNLLAIRICHMSIAKQVQTPSDLVQLLDAKIWDHQWQLREVHVVDGCWWDLPVLFFFHSMLRLGRAALSCSRLWDWQDFLVEKAEGKTFQTCEDDVPNQSKATEHDRLNQQNLLKSTNLSFTCRLAPAQPNSSEMENTWTWLIELTSHQVHRIYASRSLRGYCCRYH